jgi:isopenicillin N synthase-like dioxygenase
MPHSAFDIFRLSTNSPETKPQRLDELRHALFNIGLMYIKNTEIPDVHPDGMKLTERL